MLQVSDRVQTMLMRIEADLDRAESKIGDKLHLLDTDNDGVISKQELQDALKFLQVRLPSCGFFSSWLLCHEASFVTSCFAAFEFEPAIAEVAGVGCSCLSCVQCTVLIALLHVAHTSRH